jgi:hypothetical protein
MITILSDGGLSEFIPQTAAARRENIHRIPHHVSSQQSLNVLTDMLTVSAETLLTHRPEHRHSRAGGKPAA